MTLASEASGARRQRGGAAVPEHPRHLGRVQRARAVAVDCPAAAKGRGGVKARRLRAHGTPAQNTASHGPMSG